MGVVIPDQSLPYATTSLCDVCPASVAAMVVEEGGEVFLEKVCMVHGAQRTRGSTDARWYAETRATEHASTAPTGSDGRARCRNSLEQVRVATEAVANKDSRYWYPCYGRP